MSANLSIPQLLAKAVECNYVLLVLLTKLDSPQD